jgi:hypothetical protein
MNVCVFIFVVALSVILSHRPVVGVSKTLDNE